MDNLAQHASKASDKTAQVLYSGVYSLINLSRLLFSIREHITLFCLFVFVVVVAYFTVYNCQESIIDYCFDNSIFISSFLSVYLYVCLSLREKDLSAKVIVQVDGHKTSVLNTKVSFSLCLIEIYLCALVAGKIRNQCLFKNQSLLFIRV